MPRRIGLAFAAIADLRAIRRWYSQAGSGASAKRRLQRIDAAIERLREWPCLHPSGAHDGVREFSVERHRVLYTVDPDTGRNDTAGDVLVLRVFGPGQSRMVP